MNTESLEERIRQRAYQIWEEDGQPEGREHEHWERAVREIEAEEKADESEASDPAEAEPEAKPKPKLPPLAAA
jgi:hypothetical protein